MAFEQARTKRRRCTTKARGGFHHPSAVQALVTLKETLQSMDLKSRRTAIDSLRPHVRTALLAFMERARNSISQGRATGSREGTRARSSVWVVTRGGMQRFRARVYFGSLCLVTREQLDKGIAMQSQAILERVRAEVAAEAAARPELWEDDEALLQLCRHTLEASCTSEAALGLGAAVTLRATRWLGEERISSPVSTLCSAFCTRRRLLRARATSWEALRLEWVALLQGSDRKNPCSPQQAEAIVDAARGNAVRTQLLRSVRSVERVLGLESGQRDILEMITHDDAGEAKRYRGP